MQKKSIGLLICSVVVLLGMAGCVAGLASFFSEDRNPFTRLSAVTGDPANRLEINAVVVGADPLRGLIKVELTFLPKGDLVEGDRIKLARDILLHTNGAGKREILLKKGHQMHPVELSVNLLDGDFGLYPIDRYSAALEIEVVSEPGSAVLPLVVNFQSQNHQLHADAVLDSDSSPGSVLADLSLYRPLAVKGFAWFMNAVMFFIGCAAALVTYNVAYRGKKFELNLMIWMGALLFIMPGLRNMLPGAPPIGAFTDFLVFFWVIGLLAMCLCIMVLVWRDRTGDK